MAAPDILFVLQDPPLGTGHATGLALDALPWDGVTLVTIGDIPLVPAEALAALVQEAQAGHLAVLTARVPDPTGLGRIIRDAAGRVRAIVEERDINDMQRAINEINTGVMAAPTALLRRWVAQLQPDNAQGEYYVTDIVAICVSDGIPVVAHVASDERDVRGINDRAQFVAIERILQERRIRKADDGRRGDRRSGAARDPRDTHLRPGREHRCRLRVPRRRRARRTTWPSGRIAC